MARILNEEIVSVDKLASGIFRMTLHSEYVSMNSVPGQFVNVKCCDGLNALLRRPFSICDTDRKKGTFSFTFQVKGKGTGYLSRKSAGSKVDLLGPLGRSFDISENYRKIAVVGGGIGVFPLLYLLHEMNSAQKAVFLGFRNRDHIVMKDEFLKTSDRFLLTTNDGSEGYRGLVTELLEMDLLDNSYDLIYACGPEPMLKKVAELACLNGIRCQVSLEQRMGCGIGACLVCACKTKLGDGWEYSHVCSDGPVFWSSDVIFDD